MQRLYKDYDPYSAVTEASFTNMAMSRVLLTAETYFTLTFMWNTYYGNQLLVETKKFARENCLKANPDDHSKCAEDDTTYVDRSI